MKRSGMPRRRAPLRRSGAGSKANVGSPPVAGETAGNEQEGAVGANRVWSAARQATLDRDGGCLLWDRGGCWGGLHVHHRLPRGRGGGHDLGNLMTVCAVHHGWIHEHPAEARAAGWLLRAAP